MLQEHQELLRKEFNEYFDALEAEHGKFNDTNGSVYTEALDKLHTTLNLKYPPYINHKLPTSIGAMTKLVKEFGTVAFTIENDVLVAYVMDA